MQKWTLLSLLGSKPRFYPCGLHFAQPVVPNAAFWSDKKLAQNLNKRPRNLCNSHSSRATCLLLYLCLLRALLRSFLLSFASLSFACFLLPHLACYLACSCSCLSSFICFSFCLLIILSPSCSPCLQIFSVFPSTQTLRLPLLLWRAPRGSLGSADLTTCVQLLLKSQSISELILNHFTSDFLTLRQSRDQFQDRGHSSSLRRTGRMGRNGLQRMQLCSATLE